jgi:hypothetical protein
VLPSLLNITEKFDASGEFVKMKGRLCAAGNYVDRTTYNHWSEVTSQTVKYESVMTILSAGAYHNALMGTFDFPGAFLNAKLKKTHYMRLNDQVTEILIREFPEYRQLVRENGTIVVQLKGALYGLPESGRLWFEEVSQFLFQSGYNPTAEDPCVFYKCEGEDRIIIGLHVDDGIHVATSQRMIDELISKLEGKYGKISHVQGRNLSFLGLKIIQSETGEIKVSQPGYVDEILSDLQTGSAVSPATRNILDDTSTSPAVNQSSYLSKVMKLMYLATKSRPDLLFATSFLASKSSRPTQKDEQSVMRIYSYLAVTRDMGISINPRNMTLSASVDASKGIHRLDEKGHTGMAIQIGGSTIFFKSSKQKCVATSATHSEILALYDSLGYILSIRNLLNELGYVQDQPTRIQQDNRGAISIYERGWSFSNKSRHIRAKYFYIVEQLSEESIAVVPTPTDEMISDGLTKPLNGKMFQ